MRVRSLHAHMGHHHVEYFEKEMSKNVDEDERVIDTIWALEEQLSAISVLEVTESYIGRELNEIRDNFGDEGYGFYGGMVAESVERTQRLLSFRARIQGLIDRLNTFTKGMKRRHKYHVVEGGLAEYD